MRKSGGAPTITWISEALASTAFRRMSLIRLISVLPRSYGPCVLSNFQIVRRSRKPRNLIHHGGTEDTEMNADADSNSGISNLRLEIRFRLSFSVFSVSPW